MATLAPTSASSLTSFSRFFERCSLPELKWYINTISDHFVALIDDAAKTAPPTVNARLSPDADVAALERADELYHPKSIGIDMENRSLALPPRAAVGQVPPLTCLGTYLAGLLATALWDTSVQIQKQYKIRFINNTFIVLDGLHKSLAHRWADNTETVKPWLAAARLVQAAILEEMRRTLQEGAARPGAIEVAELEAVANAGQGTWSADFTPIRFAGVEPVSSFPPSEVFTRPPLAQPADATPIPEGESVTIVVPSAGRSSRFPGVKPKWMLTQPNGRLMVVDALSTLNLSKVNRIVVGLLKEHVDKYCAGDVHAILKAFEDGVPRLHEMEVSIVVIEDETVDQVQTIECILATAGVRGAIFLKDCDNQFACAVDAVDGVSTLEITRETEGAVSNVASKSYAAVNPGTGHLTSIVEKAMISNSFCVGGYAWRSCENMLKRVAVARKYQAISGMTSSKGVELAVSDLIWLRMADESAPPFISIPSSGYEDWGTLPAWRAYCGSFKTLFVDIDGTVVGNSGQYFKPTWGTTKALRKNVEHLNTLHATGRVQIILTTSRHESFRDATEKQLKEAGMNYDMILFGMLHTKRVLINDFAATNPYPSAIALNVGRNADDLAQHLLI
ncbi:hypothetical protein HK101_009702 [Irineochytrium annulatum]|nr:hypothetical protein HK101_009702 [Irineochytrium annulatum]